jgi:hypothetical protein
VTQEFHRVDMFETTNEVLDSLHYGFVLQSTDNAALVKAISHIERMHGTRMVKAIYCWKPMSRRPTGRPKTRWVDDVRKDIEVESTKFEDSCPGYRKMEGVG